MEVREKRGQDNLSANETYRVAKKCSGEARHCCCEVEVSVRSHLELCLWWRARGLVGCATAAVYEDASAPLQVPCPAILLDRRVVAGAGYWLR